MSDLKVRAGDPIQAGKWNRVVDRLENTTSGNAAGSFSMSRVECLIKNASGNNRDIGELLAIDSFDGPDGSNIYEIPKSVVYSCIDPVWHTSISRLVVLAEPIPDEGYGRAVLSGQCVVRLSSGDDTKQYVMIDPDAVNECIASTAGIGRLLAKFDEGDFALVKFRDGADLWRYELTEDSNAPSTTTAKLVTLGGTDFADEIDLSDPLSLMDNQIDGDKGFCIHVGNEFHAIQGPC
tara:strand:+ start:275 stop:982 length:708 start_codon:yes stop_codon:yes gene_type:complete